MEEDRCDNEKEVFNARVNEDEMIITISEYEEMKKQITSMEEKREFESKIRSNLRMENEDLKTELETISKENEKLKNGIINFIKGLGG